MRMALLAATTFVVVVGYILHVRTPLVSKYPITFCSEKVQSTMKALLLYCAAPIVMYVILESFQTRVGIASALPRVALPRMMRVGSHLTFHQSLHPTPSSSMSQGPSTRHPAQLKDLFLHRSFQKCLHIHAVIPTCGSTVIFAAASPAERQFRSSMIS